MHHPRQQNLYFLSVFQATTINSQTHENVVHENVKMASNKSTAGG